MKVMKPASATATRRRSRLMAGLGASGGDFPGDRRAARRRPFHCQTRSIDDRETSPSDDGDPCIGSDPGHDLDRPQSLTMRHGITSFLWFVTT
jgi:hypothetical protein